MEVPQEMYYISSVVKIISMNLHSKAGASKNIVLAKISAFTFLPTPALGCNLSALVYFLATLGLQIFLSALPYHVRLEEKKE